MATIKLTNGVVIAPDSLKIGIDSSNLLATVPSTSFYSTGAGWTASQDCWLIARGVSANSTTELWINGVNVCEQWSSGTMYCIIPIFVRKGQKIQAKGHGLAESKVYGCK